MREPYTDELYDRLNRLDRQIRKTASLILIEQPDKSMPQFDQLLHQIIDSRSLIDRLTHVKKLSLREGSAQ